MLTQVRIRLTTERSERKFKKGIKGSKERGEEATRGGKRLTTNVKVIPKIVL